MGTQNAIYLQTKGDSAEAAVRKLFPNARVETGPHFTGFVLPDDQFEPPQKELAELSKAWSADVIWLGFQSTVDAFLFHHWQSGLLLRCLVFGCYGEERTWDQAEGRTEPWERAAFFAPEALELPLSWAQSDEEKRELERIWREAELVPGRTEPSIDSRESARAAAIHYHFPGWGLEGADRAL